MYGKHKTLDKVGAWNLHIFTLHGIFGRISLIFSWHFFDCFHPLMSSCIIKKKTIFFCQANQKLRGTLHQGNQEYSKIKQSYWLRAKNWSSWLYIRSWGQTMSKLFRAYVAPFWS
jgi:hypothetical protein